MEFLRNFPWSMTYSVGFVSTFLFTGTANLVSIPFMDPKLPFLSTAHDLAMITSMNSLIWPFYLLIFLKRLYYTARYFDVKYLVPLVRLNPELYAQQYGLGYKHIKAAHNLYIHTKGVRSNPNQDVRIWYFILIPWNWGPRFRFKSS